MLQPDRLSPAARPSTGPSGSALAPYGDHLLSQLLRLEHAAAASDIKHSQRPATAPSSRSRSKMTRIEALKATAASLSNRIESEARKLAGEGINYGTETSMDGDTIRPSQAHLDDGRWAETAAIQNDDVALRIQRILTHTGHSSFNGTALPGVGNLYSLRGQKDKKVSNPHTPSADVTGPIHNSYTHDRRRLVNGFEQVERMNEMETRRGYGLMEDKNRTDLHDSSAGSISEGPLSEDERSPPHLSNSRAPRAADRLGTADYCAGQRRDYQRLSEFQRDAARCSALSSPFAQHDGSKAAWEELNKGSPLSVINIFTKNLHDHVKG